MKFFSSFHLQLNYRSCKNTNLLDLYTKDNYNIHNIVIVKVGKKEIHRKTPENKEQAQRNVQDAGRSTKPKMKTNSVN